MKYGFLSLSGILAATLTFTATALAGVQSPDCMGPNGNIPINNDQVIGWKTSAPNEYHDRAHVAGTVGQVYPDHSGHSHFQLDIGPHPTDTVEIIFNQDFGTVPTIESGMTVVACGDFINQYAPAQGYPPSPDGALVHWVHRSNNQRHPSGYLMINGTVYGLSGGGSQNQSWFNQNDQGDQNE